MNYSKIKYWLTLLSITGSAQILVQGLSLVSGILIVRLMPVKEYAWYTIANTMLGTLTILSDGGITVGVLAQGGKVWNNKNELGKILVTGLALRKKFAISSLLISLPILLYLLIHQNASYLIAFFISISLIPAFYASLSDVLLEIPLRLHQKILPLQKNQILTAFLRLILLAPSVFFLPYTIVTLISNGLPRIWGNLKLKKMSLDYVDFVQTPDKKIQKEILVLVGRILPGSIYFSISGQITIWLISIFGNSKSIAQVGALGRISMLMSIMTVIFNTLIVPRFARISNDKVILKKRFLQIEFILIAFLGIMLFLSYVFSNQLLWILGKDYNNLNLALWLNIAGTSMALLAGLTFGLYTGRGWAIKPYIYIPINIFAILIGAIIFPVNQIYGVLYLSIFTSSIQFIMNFLFLFFKIIKSN